MADCKRKTANLYNINAKDVNNGYVDSAQLNQDGTTEAWAPCEVTEYIELVPNVSYILSGIGSYNSLAYCIYDDDKQYITGKQYSGQSVKAIDMPPNGKYLRFSHFKSRTNTMLNEGSTTLPYEPYWQHSLRKLTSATDIITTIPADIYADGNNATVGLKGNTVQNGTPTPDNPIMPQGTGERTKNLYPLDVNKLHVGRIETDGTIDYEEGTLSIDGDTITYTYSVAWRGFYTDFIFIGSATTLTMSPVPPNGSTSCVCYDSNNNFLGRSNVVTVSNYRVFTLIEGTTKVRIAITSADTVYSIAKPQLEVGNVATVYEPYGYKIPILSANTTTPAYLGEVETTRRINKLVLDGTENYGTNGANTWLMLGTRAVDFRGTADGAICSHLPLVLRSNFTTNTCAWGGGQIGDFLINIDNKNVENLKSYIAQQYANGTPVTVWYVLANEETAVVNEPLMRIGNYADEVSGITIPTITGADSFDVDTTLKPSEISLRYTGWHDATVKEWDGSQWNE